MKLMITVPCSAFTSLTRRLAAAFLTFFPVMFCLLAMPATPAEAAEVTRIGLTVTDLGNPFFVRIARGIERTARQIIGPNVQVSVVSSAYDINRQNEQIDAFIKKKVDLIVLIAADSLAIEPAVRRAQAHGIPVVALDVRAAGADATLTTDNVQAGELACRYIADRLNGIGNLVILSGPPVSAIADRLVGCRTVLDKSPGIHLLSAERNGGGSTEGAFVRMTDVLTAFPHIDAVFAINDPTAIGVEEASRQAKRREFFIVGVDGSPKVRQRLKDTDSLIVATVAQKPDLLAKQAVEAGYALLRGKPLLPEQRTVLIPSVLITRDTVANTEGWNP